MGSNPILFTILLVVCTRTFVLFQVVHITKEKTGLGKHELTGLDVSKQRRTRIEQLVTGIIKLGTTLNDLNWFRRFVDDCTRR